MAKPAFIYWFLVFAILSLACLFVRNEKWQAYCRQLMLVTVSAFVLWALVFVLGIQGRLNHPQVAIEDDHAELLLRLGTAFFVVEKQWLPGTSIFTNPNKSIVEKTFFDEAKKTLESSLIENPNSITLKEKLAILDFARSDEASYKQGLELTHELINRRTKKEHDFGQTLFWIYGHTIDAKSLIQAEKIIDRSMQPGWFQNSCLLGLYKATHNQAKYDKLYHELEDKSLNMLLHIMYIMIFVFITVIIGLIIIVVQLFNLPGQQELINDDKYWQQSSDWGLKTVYVVFISWLATVIVSGSLLHWLFKSTGIFQQGPVVVAFSTACAYILSNAPALFYIYWFACRKKQINLWQAIKLRLHCQGIGAGKLLLIGLATWCAAIPCVAITYYLAIKFLGAQGSSNPIISLVLACARSNNGWAIILFYLTLGFFAPLCEEALFRGFLYASLRQRFGMLMSLLISAFLFAVAHLDPGAIVPLFCLGLIFGFVFERTKSLIPSMIAHGLWNCGSFTVLLIVFGS